MLSEDVQGRIREGDARTTGDVVEHDGQINRVGDGTHVCAQALLGGAIVVGGDNEETVRSVLLSTLADTYGVSSVVRACSTQDERAAPHGLADRVCQVILFGLVGRR